MGDVAHCRLKVEADMGAVRLRVALGFSAGWTVIFGPSGSGKSSMLRAMCGLLQGTQGDVEIRGAVMEGPAIRVATHERGIAYAPQGAELFPHLTVRENVAFARAGTGLVGETMEMFGLDGMAGRRPRELSGGERQRVSLARAFAVPGARLMLLDEPFTGMGRAQREGLLRRMRETMAARGVPVISVTHDVEEAFLLGAEVVRLEAGRVVAQGATEVVLEVEREQMMRALGRNANGA